MEEYLREACNDGGLGGVVAKWFLEDMGRQMESNDEWLEVSQNTTVGTLMTGDSHFATIRKIH